MRQLGERDVLGRVELPADAAQFKEFVQQPMHLVGGGVDLLYVDLHALGVAFGGVFFEQAEEAFDGE